MVINPLHSFTSALDSFPEISDYKPSLLDIAQFPKRELVISNLLAFYLDPEQIHGLGPTALNGLLNALQTKFPEHKQFCDRIRDTADSIEVHREYQFIDLVIRNTADEWALLIEHKVEAGLDNALDDYWSRVSARKKLGIVLSMNHVEIPDEYRDTWLLLTYNNLVSHLRKFLNDSSSINEKYYYLFDDLISHMDHLTPSPMEESKLNEALSWFSEHGHQLDMINRFQKSLDTGIRKIVLEVFSLFGVSEIEGGTNSFHFTQNSPDELPVAIRDVMTHLTPKHFGFWIELKDLKKGRLDTLLSLIDEGVLGYAKTQQCMSSLKLKNGLQVHTPKGDKWQGLVRLQTTLQPFTKVSLEEQLIAIYKEYFFNSEVGFLTQLNHEYQSR